jgi:hypothetical protein
MRRVWQAQPFVLGTRAQTLLATFITMCVKESDQDLQYCQNAAHQLQKISIKKESLNMNQLQGLAQGLKYSSHSICSDCSGR